MPNLFFALTSLGCDDDAIMVSLAEFRRERNVSFMTLVVVPVAAKAMYSLMNYNSEGFQAAKDWAMQAMSDLAAVVD